MEYNLHGDCFPPTPTSLHCRLVLQHEHSPLLLSILQSLLLGNPKTMFKAQIRLKG